MSRFDVAIIGAGMAGASLAAELAGQLSVLLLEGEDQAGYHATGRSAAFWSETYGGPAVQPLTTASYEFLVAPPPHFSQSGFLKSRGALHLGTASDLASADAMAAEFENSDVNLHPLRAQEIDRHLKGRRPGWDIALWEPDCCDIDVGALHQCYLRRAKAEGVHVSVRSVATAMAWLRDHWEIETSAGRFEAKTIVNAAGAWADTVASNAGIPALGIQPYRRTMVQLQVAPDAPADLPLVVGLDGSFYFKPEAGGRVWLSPHDETACAPCDARPEEIDIATAIARFQEVVEWDIVRMEHKWAGLRSFAPDRLPVIGFAPQHPNFFWLAGQGGFGIQTAPAIAMLAAALLLGRAINIKDADPETYSPTRFC